MQKQDHRQIAAACAVAAAAATSKGDRQQLLQIQKKHLALAEQEENGLSNGQPLRQTSGQAERRRIYRSPA